jgi:hypothetical protein
MSVKCAATTAMRSAAGGHAKVSDVALTGLRCWIDGSRLSRTIPCSRSASSNDAWDAVELADGDGLGGIPRIRQPHRTTGRWP